MERNQIDELLSQGGYEELITRLEEEIEDEYEEYSMLMLCRAYLLADEEKKAKKLLRRLKMVYPTGEFLEEEEEMVKAFEEGTIAQYTDRLRNNNTRKAQKTSMTAEPEVHDEEKNAGKRQATRPKKETKGMMHRDDAISFSALMGQTRKKEKRPVQIPQNIQECFAGTVGMEGVQLELDKFYKVLRFQNERKQADFQPDLLKSSHFAVTGARGSGKTLVGEIISGLLYDFGVRAESQAVKVETRDLINSYKNDEADGVHKLLAQISDSTVIVENIQDLLNEDGQDAGATEKGVLDALEKEMRERKDDLSIILTGTPDAMKKAFTLDDTMEDILYTGIIEIPEYSARDLFAIMESLAKDKSLYIHNSAKKTLLKIIEAQRLSPDFMNAISLNRMLDKAAVKMAERYYDKSDTSEADMVYLMPEDFETEMGEENLDELLAELENLTGLHAVKAELRKRIEAIVAQQKAEEAGSERKDGNGTLHMLFTGNPGTGKTTVARLVGRIYQALGVLPRGGNMVECTRSDLVGQYQGHTALKVREKVKEAMGGVLFIDEAYALCRDDKDTFGHEAVDELIAAIENSRGSMMVILAGYKKEMKEFLKSNPGFSSRIRKQIEFEDYSVDEMTEIFQSMVRGKKMQLAPDANEALQQMLEVRSKIPDFGNARGVRNLFEEVVEALNERLVRESVGMPLSGEQYDTICKEDIECVAGKKLEGEKTLEELLEELNSLTGLGSVKAKVQEMVDDLQVKAYMKEQGLDVAEGHGTLHMVFKGNAGTGKTTVARLIGQIYRKLGVLKKNVFVEVGRKDLVANYLGQTATLVLKKVEEADGGILFIDEAYTLVNGAHDDFGLEAVNTLVAELENRRASLMVIVAGYADEMQKFLDANQGLASRLSNEILFEDYTIDELMSIFVSMVKKKGMLLSPGLEESVRQMITEEKAAVKDFGNARGVRNILERIEKKKSSRIAARMRAGDTPSREEFMTITQEDLA